MSRLWEKGFSEAVWGEGLGKAKKILDLVASVAIVLICVLLAWNLIEHKSLDIAALGNSSHSLKGEIMPTPAGYNWSTQKQTLLLVVRHGCHFCAESMPFYRALTGMEYSKEIPTHVLIVAPDNKSTLDDDLFGAGVAAQSIPGLSLDALHVRGTPTAMLVDSKGRVEQAWVGLQDPHGQAEIIAAIKVVQQTPWYVFWRK
jgi:hypothetical protein